MMPLRTIGACRIVLDTIESLSPGLSNTAVLRAELRRLLAWLKDRGVTAVITGERGVDTLTRQGLEEYVSDCVILPDHRVAGNYISTPAAGASSDRGSSPRHERVPLPDRSLEGISVLPVTSLQLVHTATSAAHSTGLRLAGRDVRGQGLLTRRAAC